MLCQFHILCPFLILPLFFLYHILSFPFSTLAHTITWCYCPSCPCHTYCSLEPYPYLLGTPALSDNWILFLVLTLAGYSFRFEKDYFRSLCGFIFFYPFLENNEYIDNINVEFCDPVTFDKHYTIYLKNHLYNIFCPFVVVVEVVDDYYYYYHHHHLSSHSVSSNML
jgi:hypothetical protein